MIATNISIIMLLQKFKILSHNASILNFDFPTITFLAFQSLDCSP